MSNKDKIRGLSISVYDGNVEKALRKFKKKVLESGKIQELREREFYEKPTTERKRKKNQAVRRWNKKLADQSLPKKLY